MKYIIDYEEIKKIIYNSENFKKYYELDSEILKYTGVYLLKLNSGVVLPNGYNMEFLKRKHRIIYIGKAEKQSLKARLAQEIEHKRPGTFFRSIGAALKFDPIERHLVGKKNQSNYRFSKTTTSQISDWLISNIEICVIPCDKFIIENELIKEYEPIFNIRGNPGKLTMLEQDRQRCKIIACEGRG